MKIAKKRRHDIANGPGIRATLFVSGCTHNCKDCFNKEFQNFNYGDEFINDKQDEFFEYCLDEQVEGISILGGEPMQQGKDMLEFVKKLKLIVPEKPIWMWTGYTIDEILNDKSNRHVYNKEILKYIDVLIDGRFEKDLKDIRLKYSGSSNQRVINVKETLKQSNVVLYDV